MLYDPKWEKQIKVAPMEPWRSLLEQAADLIAERGLAKRELMNCSGALCTMGALQEISTNFTLVMRCVTQLRRFLKLESIPLWNDAPFRSQMEVVDTLRRCARS